MRRIASWSIIFIFCLSLNCAGQLAKPSISPTAPPVSQVATKAIEGLTMTDVGIDFDDTHHCSGSYHSQSSEMTYNEQRQRTGYKIETSCTTTDEVHTRVFSDITYNQLGQRNGYRLKLSCNRTGEVHTITVSQITYDNNWEVLSYTAEINGKTYYYKR
jgi:hypothetical protein